jgi:hypothetical protein
MTKSEQDTRDHIEKVRANLNDALHNLTKRAVLHDASKLEEPELSGYQGLSEALQGLTYGTPEHRAAFAPFQEIIRHHYAHNRHHPEHWPDGINNMSLLDCVEMLADWKAANDRGDGGDFGHSIQVSVSRFRISEQLHAILINTAKELGWL